MKVTFFPTIDLEATGKHIAELRRQRGLSVRDLQDYFGFDAPQAIYKWQSGASLPSVDNLLALSTLLQVPMDAILVTSVTASSLLTTDEPEGSFLFWGMGGTGIRGARENKNRFPFGDVYPKGRTAFVLFHL